MCDKQLRDYRKLAKVAHWVHRKHYALNEQEKYWLRGNHSLTKQLIANSNTFEVAVLNEAENTPIPHEAEKLGIVESKTAKIREVELICDGVPAVYARSVIPLAALEGTGLELDNLGNQPLGHLLFKQAKVDLETRDVAKIVVNEEPRWARRTTYRFNHQDILVSEFFLLEY